MDDMLMKDTSEVSAEGELKKKLEEEQSRRVLECGKKLEMLLKEYNCSLATSILMSGHRIKSEVVLVSN